MKYPKLLTALVALATAASAHAVAISFSAAVNSSLAGEAGVDLAPGSLVQIGTFSISDADIIANSTDIDFLTANFTSLGSSYIGHNDPLGVGEMDPQNAGLFSDGVTSLNTTALGVANSTVYMWVFNAVTAGTATEHGIFSSTLAGWQIPTGDGSSLDFAGIAIDISDLTEGSAGLVLDASAKVLVGSFDGTNVNGFGGARFELAAIPEASTYAMLAGLGAIAAVVFRRRQVR